jgi:hypothetical protein
MKKEKVYINIYHLVAKRTSATLAAPEPVVIAPTPVIIHAQGGAETCNIIPSKDMHAPFTTPETTNMRYTSLLTVLIFGSAFLLLRCILSIFKNGPDKFLSKGFKILANQTLLYFICLTILILFYTFGVLDYITINWQYLITGLAVFGFSWILFCSLVLLFCYFVVKKWTELETNAKDFKLIKNRYEKSVNKKYDPNEKNNNVDTSYYFELYEYLILKIYFCIPFYPVFKASTLKKEFNFSVYLKYCLLENLRLFFKLSWTCWIVTIFMIFFWNILIAPTSITFIVILKIKYLDWFYDFLPYYRTEYFCGSLYLYAKDLPQSST